MKKMLVGGLALTVLLSPGFLSTAHASSDVKTKIKFSDRNKNGINDYWERKYKLSGKGLAKKDNDKDGLNNLQEYKLALNPKSSDTDHDKIKDGNEDADKDGLKNLLEFKLALNPKSSDSDHDKIKDGNEDTDHDGL
ncbi:hypothetical protein V7137_21080, partial [Neobacillus drentensis]